MNPAVKLGAAVVIFGAAATGSAIYSYTEFDEARDARIVAEQGDTITVDSIYLDRIEGRYDSNYDTSRYESIAESLQSDPIYLDEYQAFEVDDENLATIRDEVKGLDMPIYVAFLAASQVDDADGQTELLAGRIAKELPDKRATVVVVGGVTEGIADKGASRRVASYDVATDVDDNDSAVARKYVEALKAAEIEDSQSGSSRSLDDELQPIVVDEDTSSDPNTLAYPGGAAVGGAALGLIVGGGLGIGGVLVWRAIKRKKQNT
ncbi:hypothetical protein [Brevibacterium zhoupengii]|uniref:hypothetical protein n=1 Tax=Brevibacterium zhoupengii TaxID=2898795 RepID=UPI001E4CBE5A|nr:hypothetical protein [Brevibacterium zhoupengii]